MSNEVTTIEVSDEMKGLDMGLIAQLGCDEDSVGVDLIESITGHLSFKVGPVFAKYGKKCAVFVTFTPPDDSPEEEHTQAYNVGLLWSADNEVEKGTNKGLIPNSFLPGTGETNGDGDPIFCDVYNENEDRHFGVMILAVKGTVPAEPKYSAKSGFNTFMKSLKRQGIDTEKFPKVLSVLDGRFLVKASRQVAGRMENDDGKMEDYHSLLVDEVISDEPKGRKPSSSSTSVDLSSDDLEVLKSTIYEAIKNADDKDDLGRVKKGAVMVAVMMRFPTADDSENSRFHAAATSNEILEKMGLEVVSKRVGIIAT